MLASEIFEKLVFCFFWICFGEVWIGSGDSIEVREGTSTRLGLSGAILYSLLLFMFAAFLFLFSLDFVLVCLILCLFLSCFLCLLLSRRKNFTSGRMTLIVVQCTVSSNGLATVL